MILNIYTDPERAAAAAAHHLQGRQEFHVTMVASEPELGSVVKNSVRQVLANLLPGHR